MTARIKTQEEAEQDFLDAVNELREEKERLEVSAEAIRRRLTELRTLLDPHACPCAACATAKKYATNARGDDRCDYCGADDDRHEDDCKPSYRTPALLSQDEADLVEKLTGTRYPS